MYYELYIDVFFAENFLMDYFLLLLTGKMMKYSIVKRRIFLGAAAGAFLSCCVVMLPPGLGFLKLFLSHVCVNTLMLVAGLRPKSKKDLICLWILLYIGSFLTGGIFLFAAQYIRLGSLFFLVAAGSCYMAERIWELLLGLARRKHYVRRMVVVRGEQKLELDALVDSGNTLRDEITGKPVHIISARAAKRICGRSPVKELRYITFHSIGNKGGVMPLIMADRMGVKGIKEDQINWIEKPLLAVCEDEMITEEYDMILNLDILIGGPDDDDKNSSSTSVPAKSHAGRQNSFFPGPQRDSLYRRLRYSAGAAGCGRRKFNDYETGNGRR